MQHSPAGTRHSGPGARLSPAAALRGWTVVDDMGEVVGSIADLMLDLDRGQVAYAVVACGGFVGVGEKLFAVPWNALLSTGRQFILRCSRSSLESGPVVDQEPWPPNTAQWHERVHAHFRSRPYWK